MEVARGYLRNGLVTTLHFITSYMTVGQYNKGAELVTTLHFITSYMLLRSVYTSAELVTTLHFITSYMVKMLCNCVKEL